MTYLQFHLVFIVPPILGLLYLQHRQGGAPAGRFDPGGARTLPALGVILALALASTTPWTITWLLGASGVTPPSGC